MVLMVFSVGCGAGTGTTGTTGNSSVGSNVTVPPASAGLETPEFKMEGATPNLAANPQEVNTIDLDTQAGYNPYTVDPTVDNPVSPSSSGQAMPVGGSHTEDIVQEPDFLTGQKNDKFALSGTSTGSPPEPEYIDSWQKNPSLAGGGTPPVKPAVETKTNLAGGGTPPAEPEYIDSWRKNPNLAGGSSTHIKPVAPEYIDSWRKNASLVGNTNSPAPGQQSAIVKNTQSAASEQPINYAEGGIINNSLNFWENYQEKLGQEVEDGKRGYVSAALLGTGAEIMGGLLKFSNLGNVEEAAGELGHKVGSGAETKEVLASGGKLAAHSGLAALNFLPATQIGKAGGLLRMKNANKVDEVYIYLKPEQYNLVRNGATEITGAKAAELRKLYGLSDDIVIKEGGGLIPTAEGRVFGTTFETLKTQNGTVNVWRKFGSGLDDVSSRVDRVVLKGEAARHFEKISATGVIGASKRFGGQVVSKNVGHNVKFTHMMELPNASGGRELVVFASETEKAAFKQYLKAQARQGGTIVKEGLLTIPPTAMATDQLIEARTGQEHVIMTPVYDAAGNIIDYILQPVQKQNNANMGEIFSGEILGP